MKIRVPATSANLGCGFDSVGFAVNLYLELEILGASDQWEISHDLDMDIPQDETNLIIATALKVDPKLTPHKVRMTSDIPLERGLGSSSSALVAGIELALAIGGKQLSTDEKLRLACQLEGHPDNVAPAILGGVVISTYHDGNLEYVTTDLPPLGLVAYIPNYKMSTKAMREVLPSELTHQEAVLASSIANVMIASLMKGDLKVAGRMIEQDGFHEKYRAQLVPELEEVREIARQYDSYATYLSGAGSTIMCLIPPTRADELVKTLSVKSDAKVVKLEVSSRG